MPFREIPDRFETPSDNLSIARYFTAEKFKSLLATSSIYLRRMDKFPDTDEVVLSLYDSQWIQREAGDKAKSEIEYYNNEKSWTFISCWTLDVIDWRRFWEVYGFKSDAVMIKVSVKKLKLQLDKHYHTVYMPIVRYYDIVTEPIGIFNSIRMLSRKPSDFLWEKEVRVIVYSFRPKEPLPDFITIPIIWNEVIEEIVISPFASGVFCLEIQQLLSNNGMDLKMLKRSRIKLN